ncbi:MAG: caspase family protein [Haliea sp.]|uniref:caspase family protein n=1 Tax=Haliea sp. TaxID=1932666 RepID=UPI0032EE2D31
MKTIQSCLLAGLITVAVSGNAQAPEGDLASRAAELKEFDIVPCLLPPRVRRLGGIVYPERRQLTHVTAKVCELRGGEYTAYDRATPEASVAFFLPLAEEGDPAAQTRLGEVYQYLFAEPRYNDAMVWYQRAAEQDDVTALRRLAHLHENGLGVERDPLLATNLWRQATGMGDALVLASDAEAARTAAEQRVEQLTGQLRTRNAEADALRLELADAQAGLAERRNALLGASGEVAVLRQQLARAREQQAPDDSGRVAALERDLREKQQLLEDQQFQLESLEATLDARQATLVASVRQVELENRRLQGELERVSAMSELELAEARNALSSRDQEVAELQRQRAGLAAEAEAGQQALAAMDAQLAALRNAADSSERAREEARQLTAERQRQAEALAASREQIATLQGALAGKQSEAESLRDELATALDERQRAEAKLAQTESALVQLRQQESAASVERAKLQNAVALARSERDQLAAAVAAAGSGESSRSTELAQLRRQLDERDTLLARQESRLAEVDAEAKRYQREVAQLREQWSLQVATRSVLEPLPDTSRIRIPGDIKLGKFYALVIGNNNYQHLRQLTFAHNDASAVHEVLTQRYRFQSELLLDATRGDIFRRVDALKETLKPEDSLLIYYAGHGSEDGTDSYWMGVDATSASPGAQEMYGVSSSALARWLALLPANHVLVIADSCYSGRGIVTSGGIKLRQDEIEQNLKFYLQNRARTVLTSGGVVPVPDGGAGNHSVFTKALVGLLNQNTGVLFDNDLYAHMKERVRHGTESNMAVPEPIFGRIEINNGHGSGQFAFLHPNLVGRR